MFAVKKAPCPIAVGFSPISELGYTLDTQSAIACNDARVALIPLVLAMLLFYRFRAANTSLYLEKVKIYVYYPLWRLSHDGKLAG